MIFSPNKTKLANGRADLDKINGHINGVTRKALGSRATEIVHQFIDAVNEMPGGAKQLFTDLLKKNPGLALALLSRMLPKNIVHFSNDPVDKKSIVIIQNINGGTTELGKLENSPAKIGNKDTIESNFV